MPNLRNIFRTIKPFLGKMEVEIDRNRQLIYFKRNGKTEIMNVNQLFDEIEGIFSKVRPSAPAAPITLDPFGGGSIDRISPPGGPYSGSWLPNCGKPRSNPLGNNHQALREPARPLAAPKS